MVSTIIKQTRHCIVLHVIENNHAGHCSVNHLDGVNKNELIEKI